MSLRLKIFPRGRGKASSSAKPNPQLQSLFLTLLPLDVRLLIYEHILVVKQRLHVVDWHRHDAKLSHIACDGPGNDTIRHSKCWNHMDGLGKPFKPTVITLGILQSCRLVYVSISIGLLPFNFPDMSHIHYQTFRGSRCSLQAERIQPRNPFDTRFLCCPYSSYFPQFDPRFESASILVCMVPRV